MTVPKNDKYKDYARYAEQCLNMVASTRDEELRRIQREMAAEWLRLADAIRHPRRFKQSKWNDAARSETKRGPLPAGVAAAEGLIERTASNDKGPANCGSLFDLFF